MHLNRPIQFKVDRLQIIVVAKKYIYVSQLFISRMPKMRAIPQLVSGSCATTSHKRSPSISDHLSKNIKTFPSQSPVIENEHL